MSLLDSNKNENTNLAYTGVDNDSPTVHYKLNTKYEKYKKYEESLLVEIQKMQRSLADVDKLLEGIIIQLYTYYNKHISCHSLFIFI
jgi:hypothetical protein